jgi:hypothetical protein
VDNPRRAGARTGILVSSGAEPTSSAGEVVVPGRKLPAELVGRPFTVARAEVLLPGQHRVRMRSLAIPTSGVRVDWPGRAAPGVAELAAAVALALPRTFAYSHETAARLLELPVPAPWTPGERLHVMTPTGATRVQRSAVLAHGGLERRTTVVVDGMPVVHPVDTFCDLAGQWRLADLVAYADAMIRRWPTTHEGLADRVAHGRPTRHRARAAHAIGLARPEAASPMESRARVAFVAAGLLEPELNARILDEAGQWVATCDFVWRAARVIVEYEGDHHRTDRRQWQSDIARIRMLEALGWRVLRITATDLRAGRVPATVALIAAALAGTAA